MEKYLHVLKETRLFSGASDTEISAMTDCLGAHVRRFKKGEYIYRTGDHVQYLAILAEGSLHIRQDDYWGNGNIINIIQPGEMFGEAYIAPDSGPVINDVAARLDSVVIFFDVEKLLSVCPNACPFHSLIIKNLFFIISERNRELVQKLGHMAQRSTRKKLISYLSGQAAKNNSSSFTIPFNRQQLADFLAVDRSAMSNELCKMRDDGLIRFDRNRFTLL